MVNIHSYLANPILLPDASSDWQSKAVFNGSIIKDDNHYLLAYRALGNTSTIGIASSSDGHNFSDRRQILVPEYDWEKYGCEDPRITKIDDTYIIFYTAIASNPPGSDSIKIAVAISKDLKIWHKHLVTPFNAKAMALFPQKINGKYVAILTVNTDRPPSRIGLAYFSKIEDIWDSVFWADWYRSFISKPNFPDLRRTIGDHLEVGTVPLSTDSGWLLVYSHIQDYLYQDRLFGIEAVLLDKSDPSKVIGRTHKPLMVPQEDYELSGMVPNVIFPSGSLIFQDQLFIYYGAADTTIAVAKCNLSELISDLKKNKNPLPKLIRHHTNPIIVPDPHSQWQSKAVFNPAAISIADKTYIIYRAMSQDNTSSLGLAISSDGLTVDEKLPEPIYIPAIPPELKSRPDCFSGCEDPRITRIDDRLYMTYTAYDGSSPPKIAITSILVSDFVSQRWTWTKPKIISSFYHDDKNCCLFPEKINNQYVFMHRPQGKGIVLDLVDSLEFDNGQYLEGDICFTGGFGDWEGLKIGISTPPIKTCKGWFLLYHGVNKHNHNYSVGAMLLDLTDPTKIIAISPYPLLEPETDYEKFGQVNNVVFPCGSVFKDGKLFVYYGGADQVVAVATSDLKELVCSLSPCK